MKNNRQKGDWDEKNGKNNLILHITPAPQTPFEQIKEKGTRLIANLICIGFVIIVVLVIIGSCVS